MSTIIRRPDTFFRGRSTAHSLCTKMKATHPTDLDFIRFKRSAAARMKENNLFQEKDKNWKEFVKGMLLLEPLLCLYEGQWPLEYYYNVWRKHQMEKERVRKLAAKKTPNKIIFETITNHPKVHSNASQSQNQRERHASTKRKRDPSSDVEIVRVSRIGPKPPLNSIDDGSRTVAKSPANRPQITQVETQPLPPAYVESRRQNTAYINPFSQDCVLIELQPMPSTFSFPSFSSRVAAKIKHASEPTFTPTNDHDVRDRTIPVTVNCVYCPASTQVADPLFNSQLREVVEDPKLLEALARVGVHFDQHLELLQRADLRRGFFEKLPPQRMGDSTKTRLERLFANTQRIKDFGEHDKARVVSRDMVSWDSPLLSISFESVAQPPIHIEEELIDLYYPTFRIRLQKLMEMEDDDHTFHDLLSTMKHMLNAYFVTNTPNAGYLREVINSICDSKPSQFEKFKNYWPIRICLNRKKKRAEKFIQPQYSQAEEAQIYADIFAERIKFSIDPTWANGSSASRHHVPRRSHRQHCLRSDRASYKPAPPEPSNSTNAPTSPPKIIERIPCKTHPHVINPSLIPPTMLKHLHDQGVGELIPFIFLIRNGRFVRSDEDYAEFRNLSVKYRACMPSVIALQNKMSEFQKFLFDIAF